MVDKSQSPEEEYFWKLNQELISERRKVLDAQRKEQEAEARKETHWMKCPKCGSNMTEIEMSGILVDRCDKCHGIFFDHGELETLLEAQKPNSFLGGLKKLL